eukprot:TRINITY_DN100777_c0_g1_i1.p1 TRINITY_DN100777_c0_g1~~TRINITY_DN100777_c0_g1_i1.p1  ORF type:complete len:213 (-),score=23.95 TRINITY_DN100777_c0_g1_i1:325-963(-)
MTPPLRCLMFLGSTRTARIGPRVADYVQGKMAARGMQSEIIDPVTAEDGFFMRLMEKPLFHYKDGEKVPAALTNLAGKIKEADAYVVVTPEMNHAVAPGLTNLMSHFGSGMWSFKPSGICVYSAGLWGGARAGVQLRPFLGELGCMPVSAAVHVSKAQSQFKEGGTGADPVVQKTCDRMLDQLEWYARALRTHRDSHGIPSASYFEQVRSKQ